jgi:hypothetical protein
VRLLNVFVRSYSSYVNFVSLQTYKVTNSDFDLVTIGCDLARYTSLMCRPICSFKSAVITVTLPERMQSANLSWLLADSIRESS